MPPSVHHCHEELICVSNASNTLNTLINIQAVNFGLTWSSYYFQHCSKVQNLDTSQSVFLSLSTCVSLSIGLSLPF